MLFILELLASIKNFFIAIAEWYCEHWRFTVPLTIYLISIWGAVEWTKRTDAEAYAAKYETAVHEFNIRVKGIEDMSKTSADSAAADTGATQAKLDKVLSDIGVVKGGVASIKTQSLFTVDKNGTCRPSPYWADAFNKLGDVARKRK